MNAVSITPTAEPIQSITPAQMLAIAVQQGADLEKLEKLMDLQERWEKNQARKAFDAAISAAKPKIKPILKNREVDFTSARGRTNYVYEDFAQVALQVDPVLADHGLSYRFRSKQEDKLMTLVCVLSHREGHSEETTLCASNDESGNKNSIQAVGSVATYLQRYTLKLALGLAAAKDNDATTTKDKPDISPPPEGYEQWAADLAAIVDEGHDRLLEVWKKSDMKLRAYMTKHETAKWNQMKKDAARPVPA